MEVAQLTLTLTALSHILTHLTTRSTKLINERLTNIVAVTQDAQKAKAKQTDDDKEMHEM